ncbi:MAG: sugar phosphate isomerase/epimerase [Treponema sp.]|nr:sugar phosphate isomerase/epimerase [Treponema sp.]
MNQNPEIPNNQINKIGQIGLGSYAFRYAARKKENPMDAITFIEETARLGLKRALICENLNYCDRGDDYFQRLAETAARLGVTVDVGMRGCSAISIEKHIQIARILGAKNIRTVPGEYSETLPKKCAEIKNKALGSIKSVLDKLEKYDLYFGLENHFDLTAADLADLVTRINSSHVGFIYDTTNCIGLIEKPLDVLQLMKNKLFSVHLKDYECYKTDGGYFFAGVDLGKGSLDIHAVIQTVLASAPAASFIVEYAINPPPGLGEEELLAWERERAAVNIAAMTKAAGL